MLIEFSVNNFRSIKDMQTLSFLATAINAHEKTNVFAVTENTRLLKSTCVYGANGSGKSNLIKAMWAMLGFVKAPFEDRKKFNEHIQPFKLSTATRNEGSFFQIVFIVEAKTYRYGFVYLNGEIVSEWLFGTANKNEVAYFTREGNNIFTNRERFKEGIGLESKTREDTLFLNAVYAFNGRITALIRTFLDQILVIRGFESSFEKTLKDFSRTVLKEKYDIDARSMGCLILPDLKAYSDCMEEMITQERGFGFFEKVRLETDTKGVPMKTVFKSPF